MENTATVIDPADASGVAEDTFRAQAQQATAEAIRRAHLRTERNIRVLGRILQVIGILGIFGALRSLRGVNSNPFVLIDLVLVVATITAGSWLRNLDPSGRALYTIAAVVRIGVIALMALPILQVNATNGELARSPALLAILMVFAFVVPGIFLLVLWSRKASLVMSPYYRDTILPATPWIR